MQSFRGPIALVCKAVGRTQSTEVGVRIGELHRVTAHLLHGSVLGGLLLQLFVGILGGGRTMVATWVVSARVTEHPAALRTLHYPPPRG